MFSPDKLLSILRNCGNKGLRSSSAAKMRESYWRPDALDKPVSPKKRLAMPLEMANWTTRCPPRPGPIVQVITSIRCTENVQQMAREQTANVPSHADGRSKKCLVIVKWNFLAERLAVAPAKWKLEFKE
jgi:hypothetical protein